ncbi:sulfotransferase [soil metagenome]
MSSTTGRVEPRIKVLFIAGWGRSGSTLLANLLGQMAGFTSIGELRNVWVSGLLKNRLCGCSAPFRECVLWREAAGELMEENTQSIERVVQLRDSLHTRDLFRVIRNGNRQRLPKPLQEYAIHLGKIYRNVRAATGCNVIVDTSKAPSHGYVIDAIPDIDLYVVHLVRDPRAVAFSWRRKKALPRGENLAHMKRHGVLSSSRHWVARNFITERLWADREKAGRYLRLRYEDFVDRPRETVLEIRDMLGQLSEVDFFTGPRTVVLRPTHQFLGNPSRFGTGEKKIAADREWETKMPLRDRLLATAISMPMLRHYGYVAVQQSQPVED